MTRGTTPTITFFFGDEIDMNLVDYAEVTVNQRGKNLIVKKLVKDTEKNEFSVFFSEKETLSLKEGTCRVQVKFKLLDGGIATSSIETLYVNEILNGGVML